MKERAKIHIPQADIERFSQRWGIEELALFGSVLRDDFRPDSDVDVLVTFAPDARIGMFQLVTMQSELSAILGREVDLVTRPGVERSANYIRRKAILSDVEVIYAQGRRVPA